MKDDPSVRKTPPETEAEWQYVWAGMSFVYFIRPVIGPVVSFLRSWKAIAIALSGAMAFKWTQIVAVLEMLMK